MNQTKPFNLEHARDGAPYASADGEPAAILKWDGRSDYPLIGVRGDADEPASWTAQGQHLSGQTSGADLVMTPLGHIDGKPVFMGDVIVSTTGVKTLADPYLHIPGAWSWPAPVSPATDAERAARDMAVAVAVVYALRAASDSQPAAVWQAFTREHLASIIARVPS